MNTLNIVMCVDTPVFPLKRNLDLLISCQATNRLHATCWLSKKHGSHHTLPKDQTRARFVPDFSARCVLTSKPLICCVSKYSDSPAWGQVDPKSVEMEQQPGFDSVCD